jgi:predicted dehydrogenase
MNWLLVGTGDIAQKRVLPALVEHSDSTIAAICSRSVERSREVAADYDARAYVDLGEALADDNIDGVYIATPVFLHVPQAIRALQAGKHVLIEKPLALTYEETHELVEVAKASDRTCAVAYYRRTYPRFAMAKEMLDQGAFGQVVLVRTSYFSWFAPRPDDPKFWRVVRAQSGGGPMWDMGSHMLDLVVGLFGLPETVVGQVQTMTHDYDVEDSAAAILSYAGGPEVVATFNWNSRTWTHELEIVGTEAKVKWHPCDGPTLVRTVGRDIEEITLPNHENVHTPLIEQFVDAATAGQPALVGVEEAAHTNLLMDAINLSSNEQRIVSIDSIRTP